MLLFIVGHHSKSRHITLLAFVWLHEFYGINFDEDYYKK